jgi:prepilin-type N-terminal cleavage/methylation domain-containing protein
VRRATTSPNSGEEGFSLVEVVVTMAVMSIVATSVIAVALRVFTDTATIVDRRDVFADARISLDRMSKQFRQGETIDTAASDSQQVTMVTYIDGAPTTVVWRVDGTSAPYALQESRDGGTTFNTVLSSLSTPDVFTYTVHEDVTDQITVELNVKTRTSSVDLISDIYLRNADV